MKWPGNTHLRNRTNMLMYGHMGIYVQERQSSHLRKFSISNEAFHFRIVLMNNFCFLQKDEPFVEQTILGNFL